MFIPRFYVVKQNRVEDAEGASGLDAIQVADAPERAAHLVRPESPTFSQKVLLPEQEEREIAILMVQRWLRGRANQKVMFDGKEKRLDLINELRLVESWKDAGEEDGDANDAFEQLQEKALREGILEGVEGAVLSRTLDTLLKELVRFQEEKHIAVIVKFAERHRRLRQASESGRRQAEERLRDRADEMFRQMMDVHQAPVDPYLQDHHTGERTVFNPDTAAVGEAMAPVYFQAKVDPKGLNQYGHKVSAGPHQYNNPSKNRHFQQRWDPYTKYEVSYDANLDESVNIAPGEFDKNERYGEVALHMSDEDLLMKRPNTTGNDDDEVKRAESTMQTGTYTAENSSASDDLTKLQGEMIEAMDGMQMNLENEVSDSPDLTAAAPVAAEESAAPPQFVTKAQQLADKAKKTMAIEPVHSFFIDYFFQCQLIN